MAFCRWRFFPRSPASARAEVILRSAGQWGKPILGIIEISVLADYIEKLIISTADWYRMPSQRRQCKYCKWWVSRLYETLHKVCGNVSSVWRHSILLVVPITKRKRSNMGSTPLDAENTLVLMAVGVKKHGKAPHHLPFHCRYKCWNIICTNKTFDKKFFLWNWNPDNIHYNWWLED